MKTPRVPQRPARAGPGTAGPAPATPTVLVPPALASTPPAELTHLNPLVPAQVQRRTLTAIIERVREVALQGRRPVVEVDLDLTSLMPDERTEAALLSLAHRYDVPPLLEPSRLPLLPGYTLEAWADFLEVTGLGEQYPRLKGLHSLDSDLYWDEAALHTDRPTPGLKAFVERVQEAGGRVVFSSGRWQATAEASARASFAAGGLDPIDLLIGNPGFSDAENKRRRETEIRVRYGEVVAVIDDRKSNRDAMIADLGPGVLSVPIALPGYSAAPDARRGELRISTFEL
ncbi:MAG: hypothetical protein IPJ65_14095 [Archangiaceae bacterium]|nr:hypothetical protein [Archangiaceae bacterium]